MKNYSLKNFNNIEELTIDLYNEINNQLVNTNVSNHFGSGIINKIISIDLGMKSPDVVLSIVFDKTSKEVEYKLYQALNCLKPLQIEESKQTLINEIKVCLDIINNEYLEQQNKLRLEQQEELLKIERERIKQLEEEQEKLKQEQKELKLKQKIKEVLDSLTNIKDECKLNKTNDFYVGLGWLAKNITSISAQVPDFANDWFTKTFGNDMKYSIIDSSKKTSGGFTMKWNVSFCANIKKSDKQIPEVFSEYTNESNKINNTSFLYNLVSDYGFRFGKQDLDSIKSCISKEQLTSFNLGYEL